MRDETRIDTLLSELGERWHQYPDLRLGQLLALALDDQGGDIFYIEDDVVMDKLRRFPSKI